MRDAPHWWTWPFELSEHVLDQMPVRDFVEAELWQMIEEADGWRPSTMPFRYVLETTLKGLSWQVVVEPDEETQTVTVVTAYKVEAL